MSLVQPSTHQNGSPVRFPLPRRSSDLECVYARATEVVLGRPGRRAVTPLALVMAHDIAMQSEALLPFRPDRGQADALLVVLGARYGVSEQALVAERAAVVPAAALVPARRPSRAS